MFVCFHIRMYVCICISVRACVRVCLFAYARDTHTHVHTHAHIYTYIHTLTSTRKRQHSAALQGREMKLDRIEDVLYIGNITQPLVYPRIKSLTARTNNCAAP